jgi:hypothetical protein
MLVSAVVTHNDGAVLHTRPRHQAAASSAATPGGRHNTSTTVLQSLSALTLQQCDTATATCTITGHVSHECATWTASDRRCRPQHTRNTAPPLQRGGNARVYAAQQDTQTRAINRNQRSHAALRSHTAATARRVQPRTRTNRHPQSRYCGTASHSLLSRQRRLRTPETRIVQRACDAVTMLHIFAGPTRTSCTCRPAPLPATITPQTRAHRHTRCDKPHPARRHVGVMAPVAQNSAHQQATHATSHTRMQHTNTQAPHARPTFRTAATTAHCPNIAAPTPLRARHTDHGTQLRAPHTPPT